MERKIEGEISKALRELRRKKGLTLAECEALSAGRFKPVVLGSYERGTRAVSIARLEELADFYNVSLISFFQRDRESDASTSSTVIFDLRRISHKSDGADALTPVRNLLRHIQELRQDYNGEVLTIRSSDLESIALTYEGGGDTLIDSLMKNGYIFAQR